MIKYLTILSLLCLPVQAATKVFPLNGIAATLPIQLLSTNPWGAYSVTRRLSSAYTGSLYRVTRSSDGAVQDIGFTSGNIADTNLLVSFTGSGTAYLNKLYDQTGNSHHLDNVAGTNATARLIQSGTMQLDVMSRTTAYFNNNVTNAIWSTANPATNAQGQHFFVCQPVSHSVGAHRSLFCMGVNDMSTIGQHAVGTAFNTQFAFLNGNPGTLVAGGQYCPGQLYLLTAFFPQAGVVANSTLQLFTETATSGNAGTGTSPSVANLGAGSTGGDVNCEDFKFSEWFIYTNQLSAANILTLQQNITNFYVFNPASCETNFSSLNTNLIAYWKMDETSGTRADSSGNSQNLTDNNTVTFATGVITNAALFTAANSESLSHVNSTNLSTGDIDFSLACWVKLTTKHALGTIIGMWHTVGSELSYLLDYESGDDRFHFYVSANGSTDVHVTANNFGAPSTNVFYHIVAGHDSVNNQIFIEVNDGTPDTLAHTTGVHASNAAFYMGYLDNGGSIYYNGQIDEAGFWKKVLTSSERTQLYNAGAGKTCCPFTQ